MEIVLAIDGGGSRTRCLAIARGGQVLGTGESGASNHLLVDASTVVESVEKAVNTALSQHDRAHVVCVSAGFAGVDYDGRGRDEIGHLLERIGFGPWLINGDMVNALAGAIGNQPGVLAVAGTGSVILGVGLNGERVKVGGWGPIYGDEGSAYRIACQSLRAAAMAYDERGPETTLSIALTRELGVSDFRDTVTRIYGEKREPHRIATLCRVAYEAATSGDETARDIFRQAGRELAAGVGTVIQRLNLTTGPLVSWQGSVLRECTIVRDEFSLALKDHFPGIVIRAPRFSSVVGAYLLACDSLGWAVSEEESIGLENIGW